MKFYNLTPLRLLVVALVYLWSGVIFGQPVIDPYRFAVAGFTSDCGTVPVTRGLVQWLCPAQFANAGVADGTSVTNWADSGPLGVNGLRYFVTAPDFPGSFRQPVFGTGGHNGQPFIRVGNNTGAILTPMQNSNAWFSAATEAEIILVAWIPAVYSDDYGPFTMGGAGLLDRHYNVSSSTAYSFGSSTLKVAGNIGLRNTNFFRLNISAAANDWNIYTNGVLAYNNSANTVAWPTVATNSYYFAVWPANNQFIANVYEVIAFTNVLTSTERGQVDTWIKTKYGIP